MIEIMMEGILRCIYLGDFIENYCRNYLKKMVEETDSMALVMISSINQLCGKQ